MSRFKLNPRNASAAAILLAASLLPGSAHASILFSNLGFGGSSGTSINAADWAAQSFSTDNNSYLLSRVVLSLEGVSTTDQYTVALFTTPLGSPSSFQLNIANPLDNTLSTSGFTNQIFNVNNFALTPNTTYWIVVEGSSITGPDLQWQRESGSTNGTGVTGQEVALSGNSGLGWTFDTLNSDHTPFVMEVDTTVTPEPSTVTAILLGIAALAAKRSRNRRG